MKIFVFLVSLLFALPAAAQTDNLRDEPGYVDFGELSSAYGEPSVEINIGGALLGFVGALAKNEDPEVASLFEKLKAVRVNIYKVGDDASMAVNRINEITTRLKADNWVPIVSVREDDENVRIYVKMNGDSIDGLTVMAAEDGDDAVFINIIGQINPEDFAKVTDTLDIDL